MGARSQIWLHLICGISDSVLLSMKTSDHHTTHAQEKELCVWLGKDFENNRTSQSWEQLWFSSNVANHIFLQVRFWWRNSVWAVPVPGTPKCQKRDSMHAENKTVVGTPHKNYIIIHLWHNHKESKHMGLNPSNSGLLFTTRVTVLLQNVGLIQNSAVCTCVRDKQIAAKQCFFGWKVAKNICVRWVTLRNTPCCGKNVDGQTLILRDFLGCVILEHLVWGQQILWGSSLAHILHKFAHNNMWLNSLQALSVWHWKFAEICAGAGAKCEVMSSLAMDTPFEVPSWKDRHTDQTLFSIWVLRGCASFGCGANPVPFPSYLWTSTFACCDTHEFHSFH